MSANHTLHPYIRDCQRLDRELKLLIEDYELEIECPGSIRYAVDFSEIYAYVFPGQISAHLRLFEGESADTVALHDLFVLNKVFSPRDIRSTTLTSGKPILIPAYASELRRYVTRTTINVSEDLHLLERQLDEVLQSSEFVAFFGRVKGRLRGGEDGAGGEADQDGITDGLLDFIEQNSPRLALLLARAFGAAPGRLLVLLESNRFDDVASLGVPRSFDQTVLERWDEALFNQRGKDYAASGYIDALAVAMVHAINSTLQVKSSRTKKLRLITRSAVMHRVMETEVKMGLWPLGNPLRSPRYLIPLHTVEGRTRQDQVQQLKDLHASVSLFLKTYSNTDFVPDRRRYEDEMTEIRSVLEKSAGMASWLVLSEDSDRSAITPKSALRRELTELMELSTTHQDIRHGLVGRLARLADQLERLYQYLGIALESTAIERRGHRQSVCRSNNSLQSLQSRSKGPNCCSRYSSIPLS